GGEPQPTSSDVNGTNGCLRQLWLLTRKNFILTRRNKLWTFFELVVPIAFALSLTLLSLGGKPDKELGSFQLSSLISTHFYLDGRDLYRHVELFSKSCSRDEAHIAYFARENQGSVDNFINNLSKRLTSSNFSVNWVRMEEEDQILQHLRKDAENYTGLFSCSHKFMGGVVFRKFDTHPANLDYDILIPTSHIMGSDIWRFDEEWRDPFETFDSVAQNVFSVSASPYLKTGFLSLQLEIDFLFIRTLKPNATVELEEFELFRIPDPVEIVTAASYFLYHFPHLWMLCAFVLVIYTAREISSERSTVKDFLSVMGLSTLVFYISHVLYGSLKILLVFFVCTFPLVSNLKAVSLVVFYMTFILYGVSAVVFAALISSLSKKPINVIRAVILLWVILVVAVEVAPFTNRILYCTLWSLNPNAALYYALRAYESPPAADQVQSDDNFETDEGLRRTRAGISVESLVKVWATGERAVDGMS
ncbi:hypothetical protein GCK32_012829, partial [Trichostrongylus colubriformis]